MLFNSAQLAVALGAAGAAGAVYGLAGGELLCTDPVPPGQGARFELRLPLATPSS